MAVKNDFLIRNNLADTGKLPRGGSWTGSPDILVAGQTALTTQEMISKYNQAFDEQVQQYYTNNFYVRAKNVSDHNVTQNLYLFQVPQSVFLAPNVWYNEDSLMIYNSVVPDPENPGKTKEVRQNYQTITAGPGDIVASNAFNWKPLSTEHHCLVAVVADSFDAVQAQFPSGVNSSVDQYAAWIYANRNLGWHNVNIQAVSAADVYEHQVPMNQTWDDAVLNCSLFVTNVPVGAEIGFFANNNTKWGDSIAVGDTTVPNKPGAPDPTINPKFNVGTTVKIQGGYTGMVTFYINFKGKPKPANFSMQFVVTNSPELSAAMKESLAPLLREDGDLIDHYERCNFDEHSIFVHPRNGQHHVGYEGYRTLLSQISTQSSVGPTLITIVGSNSTIPNGGFR
ncbi:hypothetical protein [Pseudomonas carassii]|uniref:Uncharacterized protein n=1 Tax=Pseudomonas carassii TaxID=3115855 RepID=A0ABU7HCG6_9PSED|nr:hypothetical protein [Pseudomonas sp. 137P]MEE1888647.1 hypothetical protein [Pseudomonas sp. 137P]